MHMTNRKYFAFIFVLMMIFAVFINSGCEGSNNNFSQNVTEPEPAPEPEPEPSGYTITFDSDGGTEISSQNVEAGGFVTRPDDPERDEDYFMGWYTDQGFSFVYDFESPVNDNITLFAKWYDKDDTLDSDGDGLSDSLEETLGSDPFSVDTDDDGLTDYDELGWLDYDPTKPDTNGDGILDKDEDPDGDGLTNIQESNIGTNMIMKDTDHDGLTDYEEARIYNTDPLKPDTDGDGVNDGTEIAIGSDPLVAESNFTTTVGSNKVASGDTKAIDIAVTMNSGAEGAGTLTVAIAGRSDNPLVSSYIPGYLAAYNLSSDSEFSSASITFTLGSDVGTINEEFYPAIYYLDETTGLLEEIENQRIDGNKITAEVSHFSIYILLNKIAFDEVWSNDIKPPVFVSGDAEDAVLDVVFVIDASGSMEWNDSDKLALELSKNFIEKLRDDKDKAAVVSFTDSAYTRQGLTTDKNLLNTAINSIRYSGGTYIYGGLRAAVDILKQSDSSYQYIILLTDGDDGYSYSSYSSLIQEALDKGIIIYTIGMGDAVESVLRSIADDTGGKYYKASASSDTDEIMNLDEVFEEIESETIDLTKDDNNDLIPDYYAQLINDGELRISNGTTWLVGVLDMYGDSADWDGDGLKNGEEIEVRTDSKGIPYVIMKSDPLLYDSDFDGYSDYEEVKNMKTSPLKITMPAQNNNVTSALNATSNMDSSLAWLITDNSFLSDTEEYINLAREDHWMQYLFEPIPHNRIKLAKNALINYFSDYTTTAILSRDAGAVKRLQIVREQIDSINLGKDIFNLAKDVFEFTADWGSGKYTAASLDQEAAERAIKANQAAKSMDIKIKDVLSHDIKALNEFARGMVSLDVMAKGSSIKKAVSEFWNPIPGSTTLMDTIFSISDDLGNANTWQGATDVLVKAASKTFSAFKSIVGLERKLGRVAIPFKWGWAEGFTKYMETNVDKIGNKEINNGQVIGTVITVVCDIADIAANTLEVVETYGKIETNYAEYKKYLDILRYIECNEDLPDYLRDGAQEISGMFDGSGDPIWEEFDRRVRRAAAEEITMGVLKTIFDVGTDLLILGLSAEFPILAYTKTVANTAGSILGLNARAKTIIESEAYYRITEGCILRLNPLIKFIRLSPFFEFYEENKEAVIKYAVQVAQSRIVGLKRVLDYLLDGGLSGWLDRGQETKEQVTAKYKGQIKKVYDFAKSCLFDLSDALPYYNEYGDKSSGGTNGSGGGGGNSW